MVVSTKLASLIAVGMSMVIHVFAIEPCDDTQLVLDAVE